MEGRNVWRAQIRFETRKTETKGGTHNLEFDPKEIAVAGVAACENVEADSGCQICFVPFQVLEYCMI